MAQPALDQFRKRLLTLKQEVTEGTDSLPTALANAILLMEGQSSTEGDVVDRDIDRAFFGARPFSFTNKRAMIEGMFELFPPATPGAASTSDAACAPLLLPAGMAVVKNLGAKTTRYNPVSSGIPSSTAYWYHNDMLMKVLGARHDISDLGITIGGRFQGRVRVMGRYDNVAADTLPNGTLYTDIPVVASYDNTQAHITNPVGGTELLVWAKSLSVSFANELGTREYSSHKVNTISDRQPTWSMRIARTALADFNPWAARDANVIIGAKMRVYQNALVGRYSELGVRGQIEQVQVVDIDGDTGFELSGRCVPSNTGGDELYIQFGDTTP